MFRRHRKGNGDWAPERPSHFSESPAVQMRIIRTHIAALTGEMGNHRHDLQQINDLLRQCLEEMRRDRPQA